MSKLAELQTQIEEKVRQVSDLYDEEDAKGADHRETIETINCEIEELDRKSVV